MRILVVALADSIHAVRFLQLLQGSDVEVHLFDSRMATLRHPALTDVVLHPATPCEPAPSANVAVVDPPPRAGGSFGERVDHLAAVVEEIAPDVIHSHELQHGGALVDELRRRLGRLPAPWLVTNWGSDIYWFGRDPLHRPRIRSILSGCDYYCAECHRDVALARAFGLRGKVVGVWPVGGGIDLEHATGFRAPGLTSARRAVTLKGRDSWVGRARTACAAIDRCGDLLADWDVFAYQVDPEIDEHLERSARERGFRYAKLSDETGHGATHDEMLATHGSSRVSITLNLTDALCTSLLEAMATGSFPIQSSGSCAGELVRDREGLFVVPADDVDAVTAALRNALVDDALVDRAAVVNEAVVREYLDRGRVADRVVDAYERIVADAVLEGVA